MKNHALIFAVRITLTAAFSFLASCAQEPGAERAGPQTAGITLPPGFAASIFADDMGHPRHVAVRENGDVYVALRPGALFRGEAENAGGLAALRDTDGDGQADMIERFGPDDVHTGLAIHDDHLYFSSETAVYAIALDAKRLVPTGDAELVVGGFPAQRGHTAKPITFDSEGHLYVNSGAPSNACQEETRTPGSPGIQPCPQLQQAGGIWRFIGGIRDQDQLDDGVRVSTGSRQIVALEYNEIEDKLYFVMHGRDSLDELWPDYYTEEDRIEIPAEEFHVVEPGDDFGWPYTYYDPLTEKRMVSPEYGGDGKMVPEPGRYKDPLIGFPAHWAPNDLIFYGGEQFPERYRGGAFIVFHGSWNRQPAFQGGYNVVFVPMRDGVPAGDWVVFADDFEGTEPITNPGDAAHRPSGIAEAPDGSLYITDDAAGRIWKLAYVGG